MPPEEEIQHFYDGYWFAHHPSDLSQVSASQMVKAASRQGKTHWQIEVLSRLLGGLHGKRAFEIGCGKGEFLLSLRLQGANVLGCDLSPEACDFVRDNLSIPVFQSQVYHCSNEIGKVDIVVMRELIEHPCDPMRTLTTVVDMLNPGGLLLLQTPNAGEAGTDEIGGADWVGFRVDLEHLQYLTPSTVNWLSRHYELRIERLDAFGYPFLTRISKAPRLNSRQAAIAQHAKRLAKRIPGCTSIAKSFRSMAKFTRGANLERSGSYHLYSILRKK
jgi:2-polyprenyl-3-methyl-5-hydroxy-6-metoxy-1,4-benzoquinol methylase